MTPSVLAQPERLWTALTPVEVVTEFHEPVALADAVRRLVEPASRLHRDVRVPASQIDVRDGLLRVEGACFPLRRAASAQLRVLAGVSAGSPSVASAVRRGLRARGARPLVVRLEADEVRAVVSARFVVLDDRELFERLASAIEAMGWHDDLVVRFVGMSDAMTIVRMTLRSARTEVRRGDAHEPGVEVLTGACGTCALRLTSPTWRATCSNFLLASAPTLRLAHAGSPHLFTRDWRKSLALALHAARALIAAWRSSAQAHADAANALTLGAQARRLRGRLADERSAIGVLVSG